MSGPERTGLAGGQAGVTLAEALAGLAAGVLALLGALALARGFARLESGLASAAGTALGADHALARAAAEIAAASAGPSPGGTGEPIELLDPWAIATRADRDGDLPRRALDPERWLDPRGGVDPVGNDEVVVFLRRNAGGGGRRRARFAADLDSADRITLPDGTLLARRDGLVEEIDAGPAADPAERSPGTFYRVTFVHDARRAGTGRFRVVEPLADRVTGFRVRGFDRAGGEVGPCGGDDSPPARECRSRVARVRLELEWEGEEGRGGFLVLEVPAGRGRPWVP